MTSCLQSERLRRLLVVLVFVAVGSVVIESRTDMVQRQVSGCSQDIEELPVRMLEVSSIEEEARYRPFRVQVSAAVLNQRPVPCDLKKGVELRLSWPLSMDSLQVGELWRVHARLPPPVGFANPAGFDYERWLFSEGIAGTGYVRSGERTGSAPVPWDVRTRARIRQFFLPLADRVGAPGSAEPTVAGDGPDGSHAPFRHGGVLLALAVADGSAVERAQWVLFRETGTIHLIIVSGLHIVIVAVLGAVLGLLIGRLVLLFIPTFPARYAAAASAFVAALAYTALTGFEVPAVRAVICYAIGAVVLVRARKVSPVGAFCLAFLVTLAASPLAVLASGFWLSFAAVATLIAAQADAWRHRDSLGKRGSLSAANCCCRWV